MLNPRSAQRARISSGVSGLASRSFSKISTPSKPAREAAVSFSVRDPLRETVAMDVCMPVSLPPVSSYLCYLGVPTAPASSAMSASIRALSGSRPVNRRNASAA